jgi:hypothetical protein
MRSAATVAECVSAIVTSRSWGKRSLKEVGPGSIHYRAPLPGLAPHAQEIQFFADAEMLRLEASNIMRTNTNSNVPDLFYEHSESKRNRAACCVNVRLCASRGVRLRGACRRLPLRLRRHAGGDVRRGERWGGDSSSDVNCLQPSLYRDSSELRGLLIEQLCGVI